MDRIECAVIGAGVVGLAIARALAMAGREVVILEKQNAISTGVSSRNSEVIHAGMYYAPGSLKAKLCVAGNKLLQDYAASHQIPYEMIGKLIVATNAAEEAALGAILKRGQANGVAGLRAITAGDAKKLEPHLSCTAALVSDNTGIIDSHALMHSLLGAAETRGAMIAYNAPVENGILRDQGIELRVGGSSPAQILARRVVIAGGLATHELARNFGLKNVPRRYLCKGNYFTLSGKLPFKRLIYPVPNKDGLGTHLTIDLGGQGRFGPDVEWIDGETYDVDPARAGSFYDAIRRYWPALSDGMLSPAFAGIRPKLAGPNMAAADFRIDGPAQHGADGVVVLYGIESPGLTASLAIGNFVRDMLAS